MIAMRALARAFVCCAIVLIARGTAFGQAETLASCVRNAGGTSVERFRQFDRDLRTALSAADPAALTMLAAYPLAVHDRGAMSIDSAEALHARAAELIPPKVRDEVKRSKPADLICRSEGIGYANGAFWVGVRREGGQERYRITSINSMAFEESKGVRFVCRAGDFRVVVEGPSESLRLRSWRPQTALAAAPDLDIRDGVQGGAGTGLCAYTTWTFKAGGTTYTVETPGCSPNQRPRGAVGELTIAAEGTADRSLWCY